MAKQTNPFDWSGGHPALDLVNTLDERPSDAPIDNLATYATVVTFAELAGLISPSLARELRPLTGAIGASTAQRVRVLREQLYAVLVALHTNRPAPQGALGAITRDIHRAHAARSLVSTTKSPTVTSCWTLPAAPEIPLHACALAVEELLLSTDHSHIRKCCAADCAVYFLDTSKAHRRQWCSMRNCGNREKQRRWRSA